MHLDVERVVSDDSFEAAVLLLQLPQALRFARFHAAVLPLPAVERGRGNATLTTQITDRGTASAGGEFLRSARPCTDSFASSPPVEDWRVTGSGSGEHFSMLRSSRRQR